MGNNRISTDYSESELIREAHRRAAAPEWEQAVALRSLSDGQLAAMIADRLRTCMTALEGATESSHAFSNDHSN